MLNKEQFVVGITGKYPEELLEGRMTIEGNYLACLFSDLTYYDDIKQCVTENSFITQQGRFLFCLIRSLREKGFSVTDEVTILSNCEETVKDRLDGMGGFRAIQKLMSVVDIKNWDAIADKFNKSNVILKLYDNGFNLFEKVTLDKGKEITPIKLFKNFECQNVIDWYEERLSKISIDNNNSSSKITGEEYVSFDDDFVADLMKGEGAGISFGDAGKDINGDDIYMYPFLSKNILGLARGTTTALASHSGNGKTTLILNIVFSLIAHGQRGIFVTNEMTIKDLKVIMLLIILTRYFCYWKITKKKLKTGDLTDEDRDMIRKANQYWKENMADALKIVSMSDSDANLSNQLIRKEALRNGIDFFVVDTFKLSLGEGNTNDNFWINLIKDARALDSIAKKQNMIGLYTIQLTATSIGDLFLTESALSNSKQIKEVLSNLIIMRKMYPEEFEPGSPYDCKPFRSQLQEDGTWKEEDFVPEEDKTYRCVLLNKTRSGADSSDTGVGYIFKYDGDHAKFSETCKCRPKHKRIGQ